MVAYAYTRKSRHLGDADDPSLLAAHLSALARLAATHGVSVPPENIRTEIGSGESITDRLVFSQLLMEWEALPPGSGGVLYCLDPTRLSRGDPTQTGRIEMALKRAGMLVVTPERVYDLNRADDQLFYELNHALGHYHNTVNKRLVALKRAEMTAAGQLTTGKVAYGYRWVKSPGHVNGQRVPGHPEPYPERFEILLALIQGIFTEGVETLARRYGLSATTVRCTLRSPMICGYPAHRHTAHQGTRNRKHPYHQLPREAWTWPERPGDYEAACTREVWEAIQQVLSERYTRRGRTATPRDSGWAAGVVRFAGYPGRVRLSAVSVHGRSIPTYEQPRTGEPNLYVPREPVHEVALLALERLSHHPDVVARALQEEQDRQQRLPPALPDTEAVARRLERERGRLVNLQNEAADPEARPAALQGLRLAVNACVEAIEGLETALAALQAAPAERPDLELLAESLPLLTTGDFRQEWEEAPGAEKGALTAGCLAAVPVEVEVLPGRRARRRDVLPAVYAGWLERYFVQ